MINKNINLKDSFTMLKKDVYMTSYCPSNYVEFSNNRKRKTVLILPGGGYDYCSKREGEPVALRLLGSDINAFVLEYNCSPLTYPYPLVEVLAAIAYIRMHYEEYNVDVNNIALMGFSAGGHLAASVSCYYFKKEYLDFLHVDESLVKVNACLLGYPVISATNKTHEGTANNISQGRDDLKDYFSIEKHVTSKFPKTFIWHTCFDTAVPVTNSLNLACALSNNEVAFELHVYPCGPHGTSLSDASVYNDEFSSENINLIAYNKQWVDDVIHFIKEYMK